MDEATHPPRSPAELRARLIGNSLEHDREDIEFWRTASEQTRGQALFELLALTDRIIAAVGTVRQEPNQMILRSGRVIIQSRA